MSSRPKNEDFQRVLDLWMAPEDCGEPIGVFCTTYSFQPFIFEEECLSRYLSLKNKYDKENVAFLIEREEALCKLPFAGVVVDQHCKELSRNLRWDILPARIKNGAMHSKIFVLAWQNYIRVIVGSANLTEDGMRLNQEVITSLESSYEELPNQDFNLSGLIPHLKSILKTANVSFEETSPPHSRVVEFINTIEEKIKNTNKNASTKFLFISPEDTDFPTQVAEQFEGKRKPDNLIFTSPFFDENENLLIPELVSRLTPSSSEVWLTITPGCEIDLVNSSCNLKCPDWSDSTNTFPSNYEVYYNPIEELDEKGESQRPIHAKAYWFENHGTGSGVYIIGSSNLTPSGWGVGGRNNFEANVLFPFEKGTKRKLLKSRYDQLSLDDSQLNGLKLSFKPEMDESSSEKTFSLPDYFNLAWLTIVNEDYYINLRFEGDIDESWEIFLDEEGKNLFLSKNEVSGKTLKKKIEGGVSSSIWVKIEGQLLEWSVIIESSDVLLPPEALRDLNLDDLLHIYLSNRPLHEVIQTIIKKKIEQEEKKDPKQQGGTETIDPHARFRDSKSYLKQCRKISALFNSLKERFEKPIFHKNTLNWLDSGPIGVDKIVESISKVVQDQDALIFYLAELCLELDRISPEQVEGSLSKNVVKNYLINKVNEIKSKYLEEEIKTNTLSEYISDVKIRISK
ncbi:MAG: hypothetical protein KC478_02450 [Bacteriovoracaceae bacterium]|nr:hypothetical protein [Bacteriovoracaceae bacterium]